MRRTTSILTALLLALALAAPGVALAEEPDATVPAAELLPLDEANQPNQTPAEIEEPEAFDLEKELRVNAIRECEDHEAATCPDPSCCVFSANKIWCC